MLTLAGLALESRLKPNDPTGRSICTGITCDSNVLAEVAFGLTEGITQGLGKPY